MILNNSYTGIFRADEGNCIGIDRKKTISALKSMSFELDVMQYVWFIGMNKDLDLGLKKNNRPFHVQNDSLKMSNEVKKQNESYQLLRYISRRRRRRCSFLGT